MSGGNVHPFMPFHDHSNTLVGRCGEQGVWSTIYFYSRTSPRIGATKWDKEVQLRRARIRPAAMQAMDTCYPHGWLRLGGDGL